MIDMRRESVCLLLNDRYNPLPNQKMTLPFPDWFGAPSVAPVVAVDAAAARSMRLASAPMYVCAICSVSYLDSLWSGRFVQKMHQHAHVSCTAAT